MTPPRRIQPPRHHSAEPSATSALDFFDNAKAKKVDALPLTARKRVSMAMDEDVPLYASDISFTGDFVKITTLILVCLSQPREIAGCR